MVFVPEKVVFASEPPNHVREITPMAERGVGKRPGAPAPAPATAKRGRGGGGRGGGRKIPVEDIVEEWRAQSTRGRYESAMWKAAGLHEPGSGL